MFPPSSSDLQAPGTGDTLGPWLLLEWLDNGTYGMVYRARRADSPEAPEVALKLARDPSNERFEREGELLRLLHHPSIPGFEDEGRWRSSVGHSYPYLVMELVQGLTLYHWMKQAPRSSREVLRVLTELAQALAVAHISGVLHRDVKGNNIRVTPEGHAVLLDWGSGWYSGARVLTDTLMPPGTTTYRPPEQRAFMWEYKKDEKARWQSVPSDDLYALGVTVYKAVTGRYLPPCTDGGRPVEREVVPPSEVATVCLELETLVMRLLSDEPEERGTAMQLAKEAQVAMETAGPLADKPIVPIAHAAPEEKAEEHSAEPDSSDDLSDSDRDSAESGSDSSREEERRRPRRRFSVRIRLRSALAAMVGALVGSYIATPRRPAPAEPEPSPVPVAEEWHAPAIDAPDAGVGDVAALSAVQAQRPVQIYGMAAPLPKTPAPGQKKKPCDADYEITALGVCWTIIKKEPPCGPGAYDYAEVCVREAYPARREPTSGEP